MWVKLDYNETIVDYIYTYPNPVFLQDKVVNCDQDAIKPEENENKSQNPCTQPIKKVR